MVQLISMFNHKGGVSKTTTVFNLAWTLAQTGKTVIMVDADPQCNLTGVTLGLNPVWPSEALKADPEEIDAPSKVFAESQKRSEEFWRKLEPATLYAALKPAFESEPKLLEAVKCTKVENCPRLFLLPGSLRLGEYDVTLSIASELSSSLLSFKNVPGAIYYLLQKTAEEMQADYVIIDMNPSLGALNQNIVCISDFLIVPTAPDYFSLMALRSLAQILPRWSAWAARASQNEILRNATYSFPEPRLKLLGTVIQRYRLYKSPTEDNPYGTPTGPFQEWIQRIEDEVSTGFVPALTTAGLMLPEDVYQRAGIPNSMVLAKIQEFNSLLPKSQEHMVPVFELTDAQLGQAGVVLEGSHRQISSLRTIFDDFAHRVTSIAEAVE